MKMAKRRVSIFTLHLYKVANIYCEDKLQSSHLTCLSRTPTYDSAQFALIYPDAIDSLMKTS